MKVLIVLAVLCVAMVAADTKADLARALRNFLNKRIEPESGVSKPDNPPPHKGEGMGGPGSDDRPGNRLDDPLDTTLLEILDMICEHRRPPQPAEPAEPANPARRELSLLARVLENVSGGEQEKPAERPESDPIKEGYRMICKALEVRNPQPLEMK